MKKIKRRLFRLSLKARQQGAALLEFALLLPLILLLTLVTTEFGRAILHYNMLTKSVREAARYMSHQTPGTHVREARNLILYGNPEGTGSPTLSDLKSEHIQDPVWQVTGSSPAMTTVTLRVTGYSFKSLANQVGGNHLGSFTFSDISATMRGAL